ncbi:MAG: membrane protein insertion efficiency factor YidD [Opitutales bacterium]
MTTQEFNRRSLPRSPASLPVRGLDGLLWVYQRTVSPALAAVAPSCGCRFAPTCSHYAREALREHGLLAGLGLAARRLIKCGPWHPGGFDPVPPAAPGLRRTGSPHQFSCVSVGSPPPADRSLFTAHHSPS